VGTSQRSEDQRSNHYGGYSISSKNTNEHINDQLASRPRQLWFVVTLQRHTFDNGDSLP